VATMKHRQNQGGCWPTRVQELLLRAALLEGHEAAASWRAWRSHGNIDDFDSRCFHLLPQIYFNIQSLDPTAPEITRLKGIYRYTWSRNQNLVREIVPVLEAFGNAGIPTVVLNDLALAALYYDDYGRRPIKQAHILVRPDDMSRTLEVLQSLGWRTGIKSLQRLMEARSSIVTWKPGASQATLHWRVFDSWISPAQEEQIWSTSTATTIGNVSTRVLCPVDQLLSVCGYGVQYDVIPPTQWVVDSVIVLRASMAALDWDRLTETAANAHITQPVCDALTYLRDRWGVDIPANALQRLSTGPRSKLDSLEYALRKRQPTLWHQFEVHWYRHAARTDSRNILRAAISFPQYLQHAWDLDHVWEVPVRAGRASFRRVRSA
jgi:Uncharacterised nucleotidyltransferase